MMSLREKLTGYITQYLNTKVIFISDLLLSLFASLCVVVGVNFFTGTAFCTASMAALWLASSLVFSAILFLVTKSYTIIIRHSTLRDLIAFMGVALFKAALIGVVISFVTKFSRSVFFMLSLEFFLTAVFLIGARLVAVVALDIVRKKFQDRTSCKRILVYGTSDKSVSVVTRLQNSPHYKVIGFLSQRPIEKHFTLVEQPVYYFKTESDFANFISDVSLSAVLFATEEDARTEWESVVAICNRNSVKTLICPSIDELGKKGNRGELRDVRIEDLLGREEIQVSLKEISENFHDRVVMVTGAAGSIGSELCRQLAGFGVRQLVLFDNAETPMHNLRLELEERFPKLDFIPVIGDTRSPTRVDYVFRNWRPSVVFHAAAYKHVPLMEENPCEAVRVNVTGSRLIADNCIKYDVEKMVMISTDKAVNPTNVMGCSKRLAEIYVQSLGLAIESGAHEGKTKFVTTRFGNVLGSNGSVIPRFREQIAKGGPVTVTDKSITRFFMTIPEACRLVMEAATISKGNQIFVFDMGVPVKIDDLARRMVTLAGLRPDEDIEIRYTGLRPGEKLYEEVLSNSENTDPTSHQRIRIARVRNYDYEAAQKVCDELDELSKAVKIPEMVKLMKKTVPEFISNNSRFCKYDHSDDSK